MAETLFTLEEVEKFQSDNAETIATLTAALGEGGITYSLELKVWGHTGDGEHERVYWDAPHLRRLAKASTRMADAMESYLRSRDAKEEG